MELAVRDKHTFVSPRKYSPEVAVILFCSLFWCLYKSEVKRVQLRVSGNCLIIQTGQNLSVLFPFLPPDTIVVSFGILYSEVEGSKG